MESNEEKEWLDKLRKFLFVFLKNVEPDKVLRNKLVNAEAMQVWKVAFTHSSFNPNIGENYEELEKLGDAVMRVHLTKLLMEKYQHIDAKTISQVIFRELSKYSQGELCKKLGLEKYIRTSLRINISSCEDLIESFFGALLKIGDNIKRGAGYILTWNLTVELFNNVDIENTAVPSITIKDIFEKLQLPPVNLIKENENENIKIIIMLPIETINFFNENKIKLPKVIGIGIGPKKSEAAYKAYLNAIETLENAGVNIKWADEYRLNKDIENPEISPYYSQCLIKVKEMGYTNFYIRIINSKKPYAQLIAIKNNYKKVLITIETNVTSRIDIYREIMKKFLEKHNKSNE